MLGNKTFIATLLFLSSVLLGLSYNLNAAEGAFDVFGAETLPKDGTQTYVNNRITKRETIVNGSNTSNRKRNDVRHSFGVNHAIDRGVQIGFFSSYVTRKYRTAKQQSGTINGLGDSMAYIKHMVHKFSWGKRDAMATSLVLGFDLPTGRHDYKKGNTRLPQGEQLGTGSVNTTFGVSSQIEFHKFGMSVVGIHTVKPTGAHHFNPGNTTKLGMMTKYRFYQQPFPGGSANARLQLNYNHQERNKKRGRKIMNSGGHEWELRAGVVTHLKPELDLNFYFTKPIRRRWHGTQLQKDHLIEVGFGYRF